MRNEPETGIKTDHFSPHLTHQFKLNVPIYDSKNILLAFLLFKSPFLVLIMAGQLKKWLISMVENLYRLIASLTLVNFSILQVTAKPILKSYMLNSRFDKNLMLKPESFYFLNSLNLNLTKKITQVSVDSDYYEGKSMLPQHPNGTDKNNVAVAKLNSLSSLSLATEELTKTATFSKDAVGRQILFSPYTKSLLRIPADQQLIDIHDMFQCFSSTDRGLLKQKWDWLETKGLALDEIVRLDKGKDAVWLRIKAVSKAADKNGFHIIGSIQDISEYKEIEERLTIQKEEAEKAKEAKSEFVSLMSHEIRTPLNAIHGLTYLLLQEENIEGKFKENLESIRFSSETLMGLINSTLDYSRIEAGKIELEKINFPLTDVLTGIHRTLNHRAAEKNLEFKLNLDPDTPAIVAGDSARLSQILNNLTSNAIKFTQTGSVTLSTKVLYESDQDYVLEFSVVDTGLGIPKDRQERIFESFVQASASTHRQFGGTGLGLAITKKIIELHKGKIQLISAPGKGSTFKVWLRYSKPNPEMESLVQTTTSETSYSSLAGVKVLVVDDNSMNKLVARKLLQRWQVEVDTAVNGAIALDKVKTTFYDLILMDINMPVMNGFDAIKEIRKLDTGLPIIALTASAREEEKNKVLAIGGNDYISKPFVPEELYQKLMYHLVLTKKAEA